MSYKLGILDQSPVMPGKTAYDALQDTIELAKKADDWGYSRFWVSEHHHMEEVAGSSPEVLISHLLARTDSIRIGSGGVMLQHYSPYKVAENFNLLSTLAPGRVDLGIGKAPGGLPLSTKALQFGNPNKGINFEERLGLLQQLVDGELNSDHPLTGIEALPTPPVNPGMFLLGASPNSAALAASLGINFVFARFINGDDSVLEEAVEVYRNGFPGGTLIVALAAIGAPTQEEAESLALENKLYRITLQSGNKLTVVSQDQVNAFEKQTDKSFEVEEVAANLTAGTPEFVKAELDNLHSRYQVDEFILHTPLKKEAERRRSFELLSPLYLKKDKILS